MLRTKEEKIYKFGDCYIDARRHRLYRGTEHLQLPPKTYAILEMLVEHAGKLVEKETILEQIWPDQYVEESNLSQHIYKLRKTFGDNPKSQDYILTVPGRGYIFIHEVEEEGRETTEWSAQESEELPSEWSTNSLESPGARWRDLLGVPIFSRRLWLKLIPIILVVLFILLLFKTNREKQKAVVSSQQGVANFVTLVTFPGEESHPSFSPDGRYIAFTSEGETRDNQDIYVKMLDQDVSWQVTSHPDRDIQAVWSPDGARLAFLRSSGQFGSPYKLIIVPVRSGVEQEIAAVSGGLSWSPDGKYLAASVNDGPGTATNLCLISVDSRERRKLATAPDNVYDSNQQFSPDGERIAFVRWKNNSSSELFLFTMGTGELKQLTTDERTIPDFQWAPNGEELYFISNRKGNNLLWRVGLGGEEPVLMAKAPVNINSIAISPDGEGLAFVQPITDTLIDIFKMSGSKLSERRTVCRINSSRADDSPRFSPDGSRIAFVSTRSGLDELWIANSDCTNQYQLTRFNQHGVGSPRWSPDGQTIAFDRNFNDNTDIFTIRVNGTDLRQLTTDKAVEIMPNWSADGKWIYFGSSKTSISRIFRIPAVGGEAMPVTESPGREAIESADGKTLYYTNADHLWRKDLLSGREEVLPELANVRIGRYWDIVGSTLYYVSSPSDRLPIVTSFNLESSRSTPLFELPGSLAQWVPGIVFTASDNLLAIGYVTARYGDINLLRQWK